jgi:hypothetical protein
MNRLLFAFLIALAAFGVNAEDANPYRVSTSVVRQGDVFQIQASYLTPLSTCEAYRYLTDYEAAKKVPGVLDSKVIKRVGDKTTVERWAQEKILFININLHTVLEYREVPFQKTEFVQITGDSKQFTGQWEVEPNRDAIYPVKIKYTGVLEPNSVLPMFVLEYFIKNNLNERFQIMAKFAAEKRAAVFAACDLSH